MSLRQMVRECFINNTNDVTRFDALLEIRREAKSKDAQNDKPDPDRIDKIITSEIVKIREGKNEGSTDKQHSEPVQQPEPREPEQVQELQGVQKEKLDKDLSRRANYSRKPVPEGLTNSGTRKTGAAGGRSIVDGIL